MIGKDIHQFAQELWPINRSITGEGVRETLKKYLFTYQILKLNQYLQIPKFLTGLYLENGML